MEMRCFECWARIKRKERLIQGLKAFPFANQKVFPIDLPLRKPRNLIKSLWLAYQEAAI
jgi:hypothetical protein